MTALAARPDVRRAPALSRTLVLRCAVYLGPLSVAVASAGFLGRLPWQVPAGTLLLGWSTMQAVSGAGADLNRRAGIRLVGLGFLAAASLWCALVLLAPTSATGAEEARALAVGLCGLMTLATVTAARAGRTEAAVVRWGLPCWLLAAVAVAGTIGDTWAARVPVLLLLPVAVAAAAWRAFRPALRRPALHRPASQRPVLRRPVLRRPVLRRPVLRPALRRPASQRAAGRGPRNAALRLVGLRLASLLPAGLRPADLRAADLRAVDLRAVDLRPADLRAVDLREVAVRAVLGAGQAAGAVLLWRAGPPAATSPVVLPLLAAVPLLEALIGWHRRQVESSLDLADTSAEHRRHVSGVTLVTVAALAPLFAAGVALALAAYRIESARETVLAVAGGVLLSGLVASTLLLAAQGRTVVAALLAVAPPLAAVVTHLIPALPPDPLRLVVAILAATHLVGLLTVAHTAADPRRTS